MIPLRDNIPSRTFPFITVALILANVAAFGLEISKGRHLSGFLLQYGLVPVRFSQLRSLPEPETLWLSPLTSMFLHGGLLHLISNIWVLWIFGDNVEDRLGHLRYLVFYLLCGIAAALAQLGAAWGSPVPVIGASGAIAGVMGAYFLLYPHARVLTLVPVFILFYRAELPAYIFLAFWFVSQVYFGSGVGPASGVAWWAHIGGFLAGMVLVKALLGSRARFALFK